MGMIIKVKKSYFNYLLSTISDHDHDAEKEYTKLCTLLFNTPYVVLNPMDANRVSDVTVLRDSWLNSIRIKDEQLRLEYAKDIEATGTSILEVLIALVLKINNQVLADPDRPELPANLFWNLIDNIVAYGSFGSKYTKASEVLTDDIWCDFASDTMIACLNRINTRTYHPDGVGGLFPLRNPKINQRKEELWTCCMACINENYY